MLASYGLELFEWIYMAFTWHLHVSDEVQHQSTTFQKPQYSPKALQPWDMAATASLLSARASQPIATRNRMFTIHWPTETYKRDQRLFESLKDAFK